MEKCKCGKEFELNEESVIIDLYTNEEGEEYTEYFVECPHCGFDTKEGSDWGHKDLNEVIELINEEI